MTDNEIIKALECCRCDDGDLSNCEDCPLVECKNLFVCHSKLSSNALDLINRQEKKIKWLNTDYEKLHLKFEDIENELKYQRRIYKTAIEENQNLKAEIERLKEENENLQYYLDCECSTSADVSAMLIGEEQIKAEAYKEFAERLDEEVDRMLNENWLFEAQAISSLYSIKNFIVKIKKEMVGDV